MCVHISGGGGGSKSKHTRARALGAARCIPCAYFAVCFFSCFFFFGCSCFLLLCVSCVLFVLCFVCVYDVVFWVVFLTDLRIYIYIHPVLNCSRVKINTRG